MELSIEIDPNREAERQRYLVMGAELITLKFRGSQYSVFEHVTRPGYGGPPPHRHLTQDEGWYILEGEFTFEVEGKSISFQAGCVRQRVERPPALIQEHRSGDRTHRWGRRATGRL